MAGREKVLGDMDVDAPERFMYDRCAQTQRFKWILKDLCPNGRRKQRRMDKKLFVLMYLWLVMSPILVRGFQLPPMTRKNNMRRVAAQHNAFDPAFSFLEPLLSASSDSTNAIQLPSPVVLAGLLLAAPILGAIIQGGTAVVEFRRKYADAPLPRIPAHGVMISGKSLPSEEVEPLRLLVIGDSLAVAVGQAVSCTPVMPAAIASQISKATGKPVFWTCFGETGASTPWIIRMIEEANTLKYPEFKVPDDPRANGYSDFQAEGSLLQEDSDIVEEWKKQLYTYRQSFRELYFDPESWPNFDIVVLVTGTNDLKATMFPFLLDEEDKELRRQIKARKGGLVEDVQLFIETLSRKMERGFQRTYDDFMETAEELSETLRRGLEEIELYFDVNNSTELVESPTTKASPAYVPSEKQTLISPLFVLPGSPIRIVPAMRQAPLSWLSVPVFDYMDDKKKDFAMSQPSDILFVDDPTAEDAIDYESQRGRLWTERAGEEILLKVTDTSYKECKDIEAEMKTYYETKGAFYDTVHTETPLSEWPGKPGTKVFSVDTIHPNESGYDMWGRHIGLAIAEQLEKENSFDPSRVAEIAQEQNDEVLVDASSTNGLME